MWKRSSSRKGATRPAGFIEPCLPVRHPRPPSGDKWLHEIKSDGYRLLVSVEGGAVRLWTRNGFDWTARYPAVIAAARRLGRDVLLDGEVVIQDEFGRTDFDALHESRGPNSAAVLIAFDLLRIDGRDLRQAPLEERRGRLEEILAGQSHGLAMSEGWKGEGADLYRVACQAGLEGIVSKRLGSRYQSGSCDAWRKTICERAERVTVTDYAEPDDDAPVLFVASENEGQLVPAGHVSLTGDDATSILDRVKGQALAVRRQHKGRIPVSPGITINVVHRGPPGRLRHAKVAGHGPL